MALERAGIELPAYNSFLADLQETIPAMNSRAFYSNETGGFVHYEDASSKESELLKQYNILEYNNMFDKDMSENFFPFYSGEATDE